ncbi:hypothetical protein [Devosia sp. Root105]|uniref:hypothetical protein n=1 Tax=Devosia sp. Root105 TaxID=1736423 RepID=UPI0006F3A1CC|nr:hypothetical protein [Devosia sp. Root105]KQU96456.1 hypothetical protein ASC68_13845 [Devosia sp. Root105]
MKKGAPQFEPRWPNLKAIKVGWLAGRGNQSTDIARYLADGTSAETIRTQLQRAELDLIGKDRNIVYVPVRLTAYERKMLGRVAEARGMSLEQWMRDIVVNAGIPNDLYDAVVDP